MNRPLAFALGIALGLLAFGPILLAQDSTVLGGYARKDGISQKLRLVELPGTVYAGNNVTLGTTSSYTGTATASGNVACVADCSMTATATGTGTGTASNTGTLTFTGTYSTTETGTNAGFGWTGTAMVTGTASVTSTGTHTKSTTGAGTITATNDGTNTATGTVTGSVVNVKNGTGTGSGASTRTAYLALAKSWTGSGTWTVSTTYTLTGTTTATITGTGTTTDTVYPLMTGTGSNSWTGTLLQTNTTTGSVALSSANGRLIIGANLTASATATYAQTQTLVSPGGTKSWSSTLTVTQTDIAQTTPAAGKIPIADTDGKLNAWITFPTVTATATTTAILHAAEPAFLTIGTSTATYNAVAIENSPTVNVRRAGLLRDVYLETYSSAAVSASGTWTTALAFLHTTGVDAAVLELVATVTFSTTSGSSIPCCARITVGGVTVTRASPSCVYLNSSVAPKGTVTAQALVSEGANHENLITLDFVQELGGGPTCTIAQYSADLMVKEYAAP